LKFSGTDGLKPGFKSWTVTFEHAMPARCLAPLHRHFGREFFRNLPGQPQQTSRREPAVDDRYS